MSPELLKLNTSVAINAALKAGLKILEVYNHPHQIRLKADGSPVTQADMAANDTINTLLAHTNLPVLSEESILPDHTTRLKWDYYWLVDPLDGTKEFIKRNGEFTVNIALMHHGSPIAGVVYAPVLKLLYFSLKAHGSFRIMGIEGHNKMLEDLQFDILASHARKLPLVQKTNGVSLVHSRSHLSEETKVCIENLSKKFHDLDLVEKGSSLKFCMLAEGLADLYPRYGVTMEWDTAASDAILTESGGVLHQMHTSAPLQYNKAQMENPDFYAFSKGFLEQHSKACPELSF